MEVLRTAKDNVQPGYTSSGKLGQIHPNHTGSRKLEYFQPNSTICDPKTKTRRVNRKQGVDQLNDVDCVLINTRSSRESQLYIFEDNEAVNEDTMRRLLGMFALAKAEGRAKQALKMAGRQAEA